MARINVVFFIFCLMLLQSCVDQRNHPDFRKRQAMPSVTESEIETNDNIMEMSESESETSLADDVMTMNRVVYKLDFTGDGKLDKALLEWRVKTNYIYVRENVLSEITVSYQANFSLIDYYGSELHNDRFVVEASDITMIGEVLDIPGLSAETYFDEFFSFSVSGFSLSGLKYIKLKKADLNRDYLEELIPTDVDFDLNDLIKELTGKQIVILFYRRAWSDEPGMIAYSALLDQAVWVFPDVY